MIKGSMCYLLFHIWQLLRTNTAQLENTVLWVCYLQKVTKLASQKFSLCINGYLFKNRDIFVWCFRNHKKARGTDKA